MWRNTLQLFSVSVIKMLATCPTVVLCNYLGFFFVCSTGPPSAPQNLIFNINQTTVSLEWSPPADNGGRNDVTYRILCKRCSWEQGECVPCGSNIGYMPQQTGLVDNYVTVMDLLAHANYTFEVEAVNGVSDLSRSQRLFAAVSVTTGQAGKFPSLPLPSILWDRETGNVQTMDAVNQEHVLCVLAH